MFTQNIRRFPIDISSPVVQIIFSIGLGILLGILAFLLPTNMIVGILIVALGILVCVKSPALALIGMLALSSTVFSEADLPTVRLGIQLYASDLIVFALLLIIVIRWLLEPGFTIAHTPLDIPVLTFFTIAIIATAWGFMQTPAATLSIQSIITNPPDFIKYAIPEIRLVAYYLVFFIVTNMIKTAKQVKFLVGGMLGLSVVVVIVIIIQEFIGVEIPFIAGRVETLVTGQSLYLGITRITEFGGEKILLFALILETAILAEENFKLNRLFSVFLWLVFGIGVIITFSRNIWIGWLTATMVLILTSKNWEKQRLFNYGTAILIGLAIIILIVLSGPESFVKNFFQAALDRILSLFRTTTYSATGTETFRWRDFEYVWSWKSIVQHPILGLGLGARYRPWLPGTDWAGFDGRGFIHNGHLWIIVKSGLLGYLAFLWVFITYVKRGFDNCRHIQDDYLRAILIGGVLTFIGFFVGSIASPTLMRYNTTPVIGVMIGINEVIIRLNSTNPDKNDQK
jgi:hypothetical protein